MAATLKPYRPDMNVIHIRSNLEPELILIVSEVLEPPTHVFEDRKSSRNQVEAALTAELDEARRHYLQSSRSFLEAIDEVSPGIPQPDGVLRLQKLGTSLKITSQRQTVDQNRSRKRIVENSS
jgi:hypothetical protein